MKAILTLIRLKAKPEDAVCMISLFNQVCEWRAHNLLYALRIARSRTKDVDLNYNPWYMRLAYFILSALYLRF